MFALIAPFQGSFDDLGFTYKIPESMKNTLQLGMVVLVPFGKKNLLGVVLDISEETQFDKVKIKEIISIYSQDIFLNQFGKVGIKWIANYYFCLIHQSLGLFFPKNLIEKLEKNKFQFSYIKNFNYTFEYHKHLNQAQENVYNKIITSNKLKFLLYGVTGSGKTEIYIHLIKKYLDEGKQSLLLVPEIILTNQIFERIKKVFGEDVIILNSTVSQAKRTKYWEAIYQNKAKIIIGTRSALFYPYHSLGIIIVDEEHDNSYISDNAPRYDAIEVSEKISEGNQIKLLLGSGTPKINHLYRGLQGDFEVLNLFEEYKGNN